MRIVPLVGLLPSLVLGGCNYLSQRAEDFADCWRGEACAPYVIPATCWVRGGPLLHAGLGATGQLGHLDFRSVGLRYHRPFPSNHSQDDDPLDEAYLLITHGGPHGEKEDHHCFLVLPGLLNAGGPDRSTLHAFDVEVGIAPLVGGLVLGFSLGEFLDLILGFFGFDIAGDDDPQGRAEKRLGPARSRQDRVPGKIPGD